MLYKSNLLTLETIGYSLDILYIEYCFGPKWPYNSGDWMYCTYIAYIGLFGTGYAGTDFG